MRLTKKEIKTSIEIISIMIIIISLALIIYTLTKSSALQEQLLNQVETYGIPSLFTLSILLDLIPQFLSPAIVLAAAILAGIPPYLAIPITILGSTIGSIIGFALGKKYMFKAVNILTTENSAQKLTDLTNKYGKIIIPLAAISPLPYLPVLFGAMNFTKRNFAIYGLFPRAIGIILYGYLANLI